MASDDDPLARLYHCLSKRRLGLTSGGIAGVRPMTLMEDGSSFCHDAPEGARWLDLLRKDGYARTGPGQ